MREDRVAKQVLAGLRRALEKNARQVTPKNLDLAAAERGRYGADLVTIGIHYESIAITDRPCFSDIFEDAHALQQYGGCPL